MEKNPLFPKKLYANRILLSINPLPCQVGECGKETHFAVPLQFAVLQMCPEHLFPWLRRGQQDRLFLGLWHAVYKASLEYTTQLFKEHPETWRDLSEESRSHLPLLEALQQLFTVFPEEHYDTVPLCDLPPVLAGTNARTAVYTMGGEAFLEAQRQK